MISGDTVEWFSDDDNLELSDHDNVQLMADEAVKSEEIVPNSVPTAGITPTEAFQMFQKALVHILN